MLTGAYLVVGNVYYAAIGLSVSVSLFVFWLTLRQTATSAQVWIVAAVLMRLRNTTRCARIVTGPHDAHRQDPHLPMRYDKSGSDAHRSGGSSSSRFVALLYREPVYRAREVNRFPPNLSPCSDLTRLRSSIRLFASAGGRSASTDLCSPNISRLPSLAEQHCTKNNLIECAAEASRGPRRRRGCAAGAVPAIARKFESARRVSDAPATQ